MLPSGTIAVKVQHLEKNRCPNSTRFSCAGTFLIHILYELCEKITRCSFNGVQLHILTK